MSNENAVISLLHRAFSRAVDRIFACGAFGPSGTNHLEKSRFSHAVTYAAHTEKQKTEKNKISKRKTKNPKSGRRSCGVGSRLVPDPVAGGGRHQIGRDGHAARSARTAGAVIAAPSPPRRRGASFVAARSDPPLRLRCRLRPDLVKMEMD